jgi:hypothetical protein
MANSMIPDRITRLRQRRTAPLILELDLTEGIAEEPPTDPVSAVLAMRRTRLADVLDGLRRARSDDRVRALMVKVGGRGIGLARVQELRAAISEFARAGKLTVAWAETFGDFSPGNVPYYLATAFDRIYLQPSGDVGLTGISMENWFYRGTLDKLGIDYQVGRRQEYKSAAERLTEHGFTGPAREAMERLAVSIVEQIAEAIGQRPGRPGPCSTAAPSWPTRRWRPAWWTRSATATRCTRRSGKRSARTPTCSTWPATSAPARWRSARGSCRARARMSSRSSTRPAPSAVAAAAAARWPPVRWGQTR